MDLNYDIKAKNILKAEELTGDENNPIFITFENGSKVYGYARGIDGDADKYEDMLIFECPDLRDVFLIRDDQIKPVELA